MMVSTRPILKAWRSPCRIRCCLYGGFGSCLLAWFGSYALWLMQGCIAFLPFVSDLAAGESSMLFAIGMIVGATLTVPIWYDHFIATRPAFLAKGTFWRRLHCCQPVLGYICSGGIIGVALNPWDERLAIHLCFANAVFMGSITLGLVSTALAADRGERFFGGLLILIFASVCLCLMLFCFERGLSQTGPPRGYGRVRGDHGPDVIGQSMDLMQNDYAKYCQQGAWHKNQFINFAAACEWGLLGSVTVLLFSILHKDLSGSILMRERNGDLTPPLATAVV